MTAGVSTYACFTLLVIVGGAVEVLKSKLERGTWVEEGKRRTRKREKCSVQPVARRMLRAVEHGVSGKTIRSVIQEHMISGLPQR
jgi:hypothetical protein